MKNIIYYIIVMLIVLIILPLLIVKSCSFTTSGGTKDINFYTCDQSIEDERVQSQKGVEKHQGEKTWIHVYIESESNIRKMELEEYIIGVVAAEMPAEFDFEALKAQAVAARTYAYGRLRGIYKDKNDIHPFADVCTDFSHCQAWISEDEIKEIWGDLYRDVYWDKMEKAIKETEGIIILHRGAVANPVFHSCSEGRTESAEEVWDVVPIEYLSSVVSLGDEASPSFETIIEISIEEFCMSLKENYPEIKVDQNNILEEIEILSETRGGRVKTIKIGNIEVKGTDFRKIFSLPSTSFKSLKIRDGIVEITAFGNGHGVGMSQWGANNMGKEGKTWEEIIKYYYLGVELDTISNFENEFYH